MESGWHIDDLRKWALPVMVLFFLGSCNVYQDINVEYDKKRDFTGYKTYAWLPDLDKANNTEFENNFIRRKTRNYFGHCMKQRKYGIDTLNPDLLLQIEWLNKPKEMERLDPEYYPYPYYYDPSYYNEYFPLIFLRWPLTEGDVYSQEDVPTEKIDYVHGGVILNVIDRQKNEVIWRGTAEGDIYDPKVIYKDIHPAIHKLMKKFPIKPITN